MSWNFVFVLLTATVGILVSGCGSPGEPPGGQNNIASARAFIENGGVPHPDSIDVDGFLSEHVIFVDDRAEVSGVFLNVDVAWHHDFDALTPQATIQVGFGVDLDPHTYQRGPLNLALVIDQSRSMDGLIDLRTGTTRLDAVRFAVDRMLAQLTEDDLVTIVVFDEAAQTVLEAAKGTNIAAIKGALDQLATHRGRDLAAGLTQGYQAVARYSSLTRTDRVLLFTDADLFSRDNSQDQYLDIMRFHGDDNIGTTVLGIGSPLSNETALEVAQIRGANSFELGDFDRIVEVFGDEFKFFVAPVAYDVTLTVDVPFEFDVVDVHGMPAEPPYERRLLLHASSLFVSPEQTGRGVLIRTRASSLVDFARANTVGNVTLTYSSNLNSLGDLSPIAATLPAGLEHDASPDYFENDGVRRGVLLLNTVLTLQRACADVYRSGFLSLDTDSRAIAVTRINEFLIYFDELAAGLADRPAPTSRSLTEERALLVQLRTNLGG